MKAEKPMKEIIAVEIMFTEKIGPGEVMRKWRNGFKIKQKDLAKEMDMTQATVCDYESNRRVPGLAFARKWILAICKIVERRKL
jgi:predicted transcriptional regulator